MTTRLLAAALIAFAGLPLPQKAPPAAPAPPTTASLLSTLPRATVIPLDTSAALTLSAQPLSCVDDLQPRPSATRPYFWQPTYRTVEGYDKTRAFYGCNDWPTAVSATWTLVTLLKTFPDLGSGQLVREKLGLHLGRDNLDGELAYYRTAGNAQRPYGYAWFLRLYAELATWKDADGARFAENTMPLARFFADGIVTYLVDLERPNRTATQTNTALALNLLLDYVDATRDLTIKRAVGDAARRLYQNDIACATNAEASSPEPVSPCLEEATVMGRVLDQAAFVAWLDHALPAPDATAFMPLLSISFEATGARGRGNGRGASATTGAPGPSPRATWIGLAFTRAAAFARLATALPTTDPRMAVFRRLSDIHVAAGQRELSSAAALEAPWITALAVSHLRSLNGVSR